MHQIIALPARTVWLGVKSLMDQASNHRTSTSTGGSDCAAVKGLSLSQVLCRLSCSAWGAPLTHMGSHTYLGQAGVDDEEAVQTCAVMTKEY